MLRVDCPVLHLSGLGTTAHVVTAALDTLTSYHWRVKACTVDGTFCGGWSQVWSFSTRPLPLRRYYYVQDHLGSVRATVNEGGEVVQYDDYYPFGAVLPRRSGGTGEDGDPVGKPRYTGHEREWELDDGLYYAGARYYDAVLARWNAVDALADQFPSHSPYNYAVNNPLLYIDPTGNDTDEVDKGLAPLPGVAPRPKPVQPKPTIRPQPGVGVWGLILLAILPGGGSPPPGSPDGTVCGFLLCVGPAQDTQTDTDTNTGTDDNVDAK